MKFILFVLSLFLGILATHGQREWVQWGPLRVYVVGRGRNGNQLEQLKDGREINSVQDILAQLDTSRISNSTLPVISITIPRTNESITLDCITANNEPGQCKRVQDCFVNAFTAEGKIKNRALLEADVESSLSCNPKLSYWAQSLAYEAESTGQYSNLDKPFNIRDKLICCEKPRILDMMRIMNITEVKTQSLMENLTMLEMETAVPTQMTEMELEAEFNHTADAMAFMNMTEEMAEQLPNFEALIAPMMPEIMRMQYNDTELSSDMMDDREIEHTTMPEAEFVRTTFSPPVAEALTADAPQLLPRRVDGGANHHQSHHKNSSKYTANDLESLLQFRKSHGGLLKKQTGKLCIIKPHLECAARRVGNFKKPEDIPLKNKYSWMATLFVDRQMFCMGSLIDADHILTAAHCFPKNPSSMDFEKVKVGIGYNTERPNITNPYVTRKVSKIVVHEGFNFKTLINDIAIVKLESPAFNKTSLFDYDDVVDQDFPDPQPKPICFTEATEELNTSFENAEAILSGWTIPRRRRKTTAQEISIRVWNNDECCAKYGDIPPAGITDEMLCAFTYGKNDCFSRYNTGAPLFIISEKGKRVNDHNHTTPSYIVDRYNGDDEGDHVQFQIGILSWGYGCKDYPPVFTRVNPYFDWIENVIA